MDITYQRYEHVAKWLQAKAYRKQMEGRIKPLRQFNPCAKGLVFTAAMSKRPMPVTMEVLQEASTTPCSCHSSLSWQNLFDKLMELER